MERYITDSIYHNKPWERTIEELAEKRIYRRLSAVIPREDYLSIEEELNEFYRNLEKESGQPLLSQTALLYNLQFRLYHK